MGESTARIRVRPTAERLVFFTDAVVAIAMTLLILPLMESASEIRTAKLSTADYVREHAGQFTSLALSFALIAVFWRLHHGLFDRVARETGALVWLNIAWMFTIVWLPVATAITGGHDKPDALEEILYIGTMLLNAVLMALMNLVVVRSPEALKDGAEPPVGGLAAAMALAVMFALILVVVLIWPGIGYYAMFLMFLTAPLARLIRSRLVKGRLGPARRSA